MHCRTGEGEFGFDRRVTAVVGSEHVLDGVEEVGLVAPGHVLAKFLAEERLEWLCESAGDRVRVVDQEPFEERLIELAAELAGGAQVGGVAVADEVECLGEVGLRRAKVAFDGGESCLGVRELAADAGLFGLEEVEGDGVGVVRVEELLAFVPELGEPELLAGALLLGRGVECGHLVEDEVADLIGLLVGELDSCVYVGHRVFGLIDLDGLLAAVGALLLSADADEVLVDGAMSVLRVAHDESAPAPTAVDRALEVVVVLALLVPGDVVGGEDFLDLLRLS